VNCIGGKYVFAICQGVRLSGRATINFPLERQKVKSVPDRFRWQWVAMGHTAPLS